MILNRQTETELNDIHLRNLKKKSSGLLKIKHRWKWHRLYRDVYYSSWTTGVDSWVDWRHVHPILWSIWDAPCCVPRLYGVEIKIGATSCYILRLKCSKFDSGWILQRFPKPIADRLWNTLPLNVTPVSSISVFRKHLKTHLFSHSFPKSPVVPLLCHFGHYKSIMLYRYSRFSKSWT